MNNNYMLIQAINAKIPLIANNSESKTLIIKFGNGRSLEIDAMTERELCSMLYDSRYREMWTEWINRLFDGDLAPNELEDFKEVFKSQHPYSRFEYKPAYAPLVSDTEGCCELRSCLFKSPVILEREHEKALISLTKGKGVPERLQRIIGNVDKVGVGMQRYFAWFRKRHGINARYKKDAGIQDGELVQQFCLVHGIDFYKVYNTYTSNTPCNAIEGIGSLLFIVGLIGIVISAPMLFIFLLCDLLR